MDRKEEVKMGGIIVIAIGLIVGAILLQASAQNVGQVRDTVTLANKSFTLAAEGSSVYLTGYRAVTDPVIFNATGTVVPAANYTVTNNVVYNGALAIQIETAAANSFANDSANISGVAQPLTYDTTASGRSVAYLIIIMAALSLAAFAIGYAMKNDFM